MGKYYLLDLERTIYNGVPFFWKYNKHGYTRFIEQAGLFNYEVAEKIEALDHDHTTVKIHEDLIFRILGKDMKQHEGNF